jgi:hypothetical protein
MEDLAALQASRGPITLKPRAGEKVRSGVVVPSTLQAKKKPVDLTHMHDDSDEDAEMPASVPLPLLKTKQQEPEPEEKLVDLDDF